jgi:hypothetical protein
MMPPSGAWGDICACPGSGPNFEQAETGRSTAGIWARDAVGRGKTGETLTSDVDLRQALEAINHDS